MKKELFICQSCGMPMIEQNHFGTLKNTGYTKEFCVYCYRDGNFTEDVNLEQMIDSNLQYEDSFKADDRLKLGWEEAALKTRLQLLSLKRWQIQDKTQIEYFHAVNQAIDYIHHNLSEPLSLSVISDLVHISPFHFHRIFKAIMNESPGKYIQRIRLENGAFKLVTSHMTLTEIAEQIGYDSLYSFSKSFKKLFGVSPASYRKKPMDLNTPIKPQESISSLTCEIRKVSEKKIICYKVSNPYKFADAFTSAWSKLLNYTSRNGIPDDQTGYYSLSKNVPTITQPDRQRIYIAIDWTEDKKPAGLFPIQTIEEGIYAVFTVKGPHSLLEDAYCHIYRHWVPYSNYKLRNSMMFEKYLNSPNNTDEKDLVTEIYIPVVVR